MTNDRPAERSDPPFDGAFPRRRFLQSSATATGLAAVGGCLGDEGSPGANTPRNQAGGGGGDDLAYETVALAALGEQFASPFVACPRVEESPVSGSLDSWSGLPSVEMPAGEEHAYIDDWGGESDCSATMRFGFDSDAFYVALAVTDDTHNPRDTLWRGDSVQLAFGVDGEYGPDYSLGHVDGESVVAKNISNVEGAGADRVDLRTSRSGSTTTYEAAIPWNAIVDSQSPPDAERIRFSAIVNDNDGSGRRGFVAWTDSIGNNKEAAMLPVLGLEPADRSWSAWLDGPAESTVGSDTEFTVSVPNYGEEAVSLSATLPPAGVTDGALDVPSGQAAIVPLVAAPEDGGEWSVTAEVSGGGATRSLERTLSVVDAGTIEQRLSSVESTLPELQSRLETAREDGVATDYERVNAKVIERFLEYARQDIENGRFERARYMASELEALQEEAMTDLQAYLDGESDPKVAPRYRTQRPAIEGPAFVGQSQTATESSPQERPVFFSGYGHFDQMKKDIPHFQDFGNNMVQTGHGPRSTVQEAGPAGWQWERNKDVEATLKRDDSEAHTGERSFLVTNEDEPEPHHYATLYQEVEVEPGTTYTVEAWVKGEDASQSFFTIGYSDGWGERGDLPTGTFDWERLRFTFTPPEGESSVTLRYVCGKPTTAVWIDDVSVTAAGSDENLLANPGFESEQTTPSAAIEPKPNGTKPVENLLERAAEHDVSVNILLAPHYFPQWAKERWPDLEPEPTGHFIEYVIHHPKAKEIIELHIRTLMEAIKDYESLHSICLSNEPGYSAREDQWTKELWRSFLEDRYGSVSEMNRVYDADHDTFADVPLGPQSFAQTPRTYDWVTFNNGRLADWHEWMADIVREVAPEVPVHAKLMGHALKRRPSLMRNGVNPVEFAPFTDINGNDNHNYHHSGPSGTLEFLKMFDLQQSVDLAPVYNSENHLIENGNHEYEPVIADHLRLNFWQEALHGVNASTMWVWERTYEPEDHPGFVASILNRPDGVATIGKTNLDANRLGEELIAFQERQEEVAIAYSVGAHLYDENYLPAVHRTYGALSYGGHPVGFAPEEDIQDGGLSDYEVLVLPAVGRLESATIEAVADFAGNGGSVVVLGEVPEQDPWNESLPAAARSSVADAATTLDVEADHQSIRDAVEQADVGGPIEVVGPDGETLRGVEWRSVRHDGRRLVNVANYRKESVTVQIVRDGSPAAPARNLLAHESVEGSEQTLGRLQPALFEL